jgi:cytochrome c oxidase subunit III
MSAEAPIHKLDVSHLPESSFGSTAVLWWGNTLLLFIETTMFALLAATYFYLRMSEQHWPPVQGNTFPPIYDTRPDLWASTTVLAILLLTCVPMALTHRAAIRMDATTVRIGIIVCTILNITSTVFRFFEFNTLHFQWYDNAYGSITWTILGVHLLHMLVADLELIVMGSYTLFKPMDPKRALDVTLAAVYLYWIAGMWVIFYLIVYWSPRWFYAGPTP